MSPLTYYIESKVSSGLKRQAKERKMYMSAKEKKLTMIEQLDFLSEQITKKSNGEDFKLNKMTVQVCEPPKYNREMIAELRSRLNLTQRTFALVLGISPRTVESWERGATEPKGNSERLMSFIDNDPNLVANIIKTI